MIPIDPMLVDAIEDKTSYPRPLQAWFAMAVFFIAAVLAFTDRLILNLFVDPIRHEFGINDLHFSLLQGPAFGIIYAVCGLPLGLYADRYNRRNLVLTGIAIWSIGTVACGFAQDFWQMFIARVAVGLGEAALFPAVMSMVPDLFPPIRRGTAIGLFVTGLNLGAGLALIVGGMMLSLFEHGALQRLPVVSHMSPWRAVLVVLIAPSAIVMALLMAVREPKRRRVPRTSSSVAVNGIHATLTYLWLNRQTFAPILVAMALSQLIVYGANSWLPALLERRFAMSADEIGTRTGTITMLCSSAGIFFGGGVADRVRRAGRNEACVQLAAVGFVCVAVLLSFPALPNVNSLLTAYAAFMFLYAVAVSVMVVSLQEAVPANMRGVYSGLEGFFLTLVGLGIGPTLVAFVTDDLFHDPAAVGWAMMAVTIPAALIGASLLWFAQGAYRRTVAKLV